MTQYDKIKQIAIIMIKESGLINLSREGLSKRAGIPSGSFNNIMGCTFTDLVNELKDIPTDMRHKIVKTRTNPELKKDFILSHAIELASKRGCHGITKNAIANQAGVHVSLVGHYFGTVKKLKRAVMRAAIERNIPEVVALGLINGDVYAKNAPDELKEKAKIIINQLM